MSTYAIPEAPTKYSTVVDYFRGVDLNNSPSNVDTSRSPAAPNMRFWMKTETRFL